MIPATEVRAGWAVVVAAARRQILELEGKLGQTLELDVFQQEIVRGEIRNVLEVLAAGEYVGAKNPRGNGGAAELH